VREGNIGEEWHGTGNNDDDSGRDSCEGVKKSAPKKSEGNETVLLRPTQKKKKKKKKKQKKKKNKNKTK